MSNIDHFSKAEALLERYYQDVPLSRNVNYLIEAQVHATLATAQRGKLEYIVDFSENKVDMGEFEEIFNKYLTRRS